MDNIDIKTIDARALIIMIKSAAKSINDNYEAINDMNVFPVPDGDTGTNMSLTFTAAAKSAAALGDGAAPKDIMGALAKAALRNARGNSGVILSQILRGLSSGIDGAKELGIEAIKNAAISARDVAYRAVMKPTEGTILTVVREIAEFAEAEYTNYSDAPKLLAAMCEAGTDSLERTPEILPVLKQAGVVDAGGCGLMTLLRGAVEGLRSGKAAEGFDISGVGTVGAGVKSADIDTADIKYQYCTEFLINKDGDRGTAQFTAAIRPKGDCMLVIDDDEIVKVHIHTNHPGFVLEQALKIGELTNLKIDNMKYQHNENIGAASKGEVVNLENAAEAGRSYGNKYGVVAVVSGSGMTELFESLECDKIVSGGQSMNPSTQDILDAIRDTDAEHVYVLPNNKNIILAAQQAAELAETDVIVIPTKNMPQGISALALLDRDAEPDENTAVMQEVIDGVRCGQITYAARNSRMNGLDIHQGDVMAVSGSDVMFVGIETEAVALELIRRLVDKNTGMISIYYGDDVSAETARALADKAEEEHGDLDVSLNYGGQAVYSYIIAAE